MPAPGHAAADGGVDLRLDQQRPVRGPDAARRARDPHQRLRHVDDGAEPAEQLAHTRALLFVGRHVGDGEREHAAAHLYRRVGLDPEDRRLGVGGADLGLGSAGEDRHDRLRGPGDLARHGVELRRLVREHDKVGALGQLAVGAGRLAADERRELPGAAGARIRAQHRLAPAERERARHVAGSDEADHPDADYEARRTGRPEFPR
jgi:hypothetical protein